MIIQENISLKPYHTFGVEVRANFFAEITAIDQLKSAIDFAKAQHLKVLFLGGGSNILFTEDFQGLAIKLNLKGISEEVISDNEVLVSAKCGENWHGFVQYCLNKNYGGLENLSLIPGNVGASPMQNIGAYGVEIKDSFVSCEVLNLETMTAETFDHQQCQFGYRDSIFKREGKGKYVILEVTYKLTTKNHHIKTDYGAITTELQNMGTIHPTIQEVSRAVIQIRQSKLPDPNIVGNAGSFFKNPSIPKTQYEKLQSAFPNIPGYPNGDLVKVPAVRLIEQCGWKGRQIGNVASHKLQALVLVNATGEATGQEIFDFSEEIIASVKAKFKIELEREVNIYPAMIS